MNDKTLSLSLTNHLFLITAFKSAVLFLLITYCSVSYIPIMTITIPFLHKYPLPFYSYCCSNILLNLTILINNLFKIFPIFTIITISTNFTLWLICLSFLYLINYYSIPWPFLVKIKVRLPNENVLQLLQFLKLMLKHNCILLLLLSVYEQI